MIRVRALTKNYGDNAVLRGVDLDAAAGEFVVVLGESGAGKSTLLRCMNRLVVADGGELRLGQMDAVTCSDERALRRQVAMIFQHHHVVPRLTALKNVLTGCLGSVSTLASVFHLFPRKDIELARECLARVGLAHKAEARTDSLSGGQMQRVGIARALAQRPQVILADEPVASLDPQAARKVLQYLRDASRDLGITVLCNLHQVDYAKEFADRIVGLARGRVVFDGLPADLGAADIDRIYLQPPEPVAPAQSPAPRASSQVAANLG
ncbi:MAG: phosphonate ABC transporter ATP-binding protein [Polaromonas sp.]|nr:phosphonate ABC transporter ATP-binding protein [Polaromonas sp.]